MTYKARIIYVYYTVKMPRDTNLDFEVQATSLPFASRGDEYASRPPSRPFLGTFFPFGI